MNDAVLVEEVQCTVLYRLHLPKGELMTISGNAELDDEGS